MTNQQKTIPVTREAALLATLIGLSVSISIASTAGGCKIIWLPFDYAASATVFSFITLFALGGVNTEFFGRTGGMLAFRAGLIGNLIATIIYTIGIAAPAAPCWSGSGGMNAQHAYAFVLGSAPRLFFAGLCAYVVGQMLNVVLIARLKQVVPRQLWLRQTVVPLFCQALDTVVFVTVAFIGTGPVFDIFVGQLVVKTMCLLLCSPLVYTAVWVIRRWLASPPTVLVTPPAPEVS
ncbi:hypothetical protein VT84_07405 [Gemmata sp. SH-PL17]|uniref:queuosine precursor transporter n=1 Tax=Gemmata sp. SH-PL17 TaxID=1630693 RepID=UPI00078EB2DB|nr:queuosine precursor transporter [Gemmata sp. SH-PL17]AMV24207.1 hypothetical protein VT84_07405 [Gemmata sp. SH-PL17]